MKISYLELLEMVKEGNEPDLIELKLNCGKRLYQANYDGGELSHYALCNEDDDYGNFDYYLANTLLESQMIEKNIKIIEDTPKKIKKLNYHVSIITNTNDEKQEVVSAPSNTEIADKLNEIIDYINNMEK